MKNRLLSILFVFTFFGFVCRAEDSCKAIFGLEWGYSPTLYSSFKFVYKDDYGTKVSDIGDGFTFESDFFIFARAGLRIAGRSELSLLSGINGACGKRKCVPLLCRYNYAFGGIQKDGALAFADIGAGFPILTSANRVNFIGRVGGGYRFVLGYGVFLDFTAAVKLCLDHPCEQPSVTKNDAFNVGASIGVAIGF